MFLGARHKYVSIISLASLREFERVVNGLVDPIRFRANLYLDGAPAWAECDWTGRLLSPPAPGPKAMKLS